MRWLCVFPLLTILFISACSTTPEDELDTLPAEELYRRAKAALNSGDYETAINTFEKLEVRFPFGKYAQQAQLEIAYAYYKFDEPDAAIGAAYRFVLLHPRDPNIDYVYYLKIGRRDAVAKRWVSIMFDEDVVSEIRRDQELDPGL